MSTIYILKCQGNKYYVGKTDDPEDRISQHFSGFGSEWTKRHPPQRVLEVIEGCDEFDEDKYTLKSMQKYGIDNVRG